MAAERFAFIFAIAIPFDIRDMKTDTLTGLRTIPIVFGEKKALIISGIAFVFLLVIAVINHLIQNMIFIIPAGIISFSITLSLINCKRLRGLPLYYHGLLNGCIILYGLLICLSYYFCKL